MVRGLQIPPLPVLPIVHGASDVSRRSRRRLIQQGMGLAVLCGGTLVFNSFSVPLTKPASVARQPKTPWVHQLPIRRLQDVCAVCKTAEEVSEEKRLKSTFKMVDHENLKNPDAPQLRHSGGELVYQLCKYLFGIFYMMIGLSVVCDEFFVPALECFVDEFGISMDVAGATFMAAGGSMPELFTSFIATFDESEVGFAAIVGSAVFNVLFVIAVCAIASKETLTLTWWPLARDCSCYLVALCTVAFVFKGTTPGVIDWWEALLLLAEYGGYCALMKKNQKIHAKVESMLMKRKVTPEDTLPNEGEASPAVPSKAEANFVMPSKFRKGIVHLLTQNAYLYETAGIAAVTQVAGDLEETFKKLDINKDNVLSLDEISKLLTEMGWKHDSSAVRTAVKRINRNGDEDISFESFKRWYVASEARIDVEIHRIFRTIDINQNDVITHDEVGLLLKKLGHEVTEEEINQAMEEIGAAVTAKEAETVTDDLTIQKSDASPKKIDSPKKSAGNAKEAELVCSDVVEPKSESAVADAIPGDKPSDEEKTKDTDGAKPPIDATTVAYNLDQFETWYKGSLFFKSKQDHQILEADAEENGCLSLEQPEDASRSALFWFWFTYPLVAVMYCTVPDCRHPKYGRNWKVAVLEFCLSLVWIGIFSNMLYECIVICSNTLGIPPAVAAVTVLAAGTSVPDLLSSYIVAKNGEGDMAVSSSIGSNIFDVTVGLPLPWLCYCIATSISRAEYSNVVVHSNSLFFSLLVLIAMLVAVIGTIMACGWKLTKTLGWIMMLLYVLFVAQDLMNQLPTRDPPAKSGVFKGAFDF